MDLLEIGKFIKSERKAKNLTQSELAEKLAVSEKTISKWECGNGFPDTTLMLPLCKELGLSANELLSGKRLSTEEYKEQAEHNLLEFNDRQQGLSRLLFILEFVVAICGVAFLAICLTAGILIDMPLWLKILTTLCGFIIFLILMSFALKIEQKAGYYECGKCHHKYIPTYNQVYWSMHLGRTRYMRCPQCHKLSWQKKKIDKE